MDQIEVEIKPENFKPIEIDGSPYASDENHVYLQILLTNPITPEEQMIKSICLLV